MPKNIVVCCDGTANEFTRNHTNVPKLFLYAWRAFGFGGGLFLSSVEYVIRRYSHFPPLTRCAPNYRVACAARRRRRAAGLA
jgi:hypothetical protein